MRQRINLIGLGSDPPPRLTVDVGNGEPGSWTSSDDSSISSKRRSISSSELSYSTTGTSSHEGANSELTDANRRIKQLERELVRCDEVVADAIHETFEERKRADALEKQMREMRLVEERRSELLLSDLGDEGVDEGVEKDALMRMRLEEALVEKEDAVLGREEAMRRLEEFERLIEGRESLVTDHGS